MQNKIKIVAFVGKSASGKDTFAKAICKSKKYNPIVSTTTRPKRDNEKEDIDYHFISSDEFAALIEQDKMLEATFFNNWCYGTSLDSLDKDKVNIGVFNPEGIGLLADNSLIDLYVVYIEADNKIRLMRQLQREKTPNVDEIIRRFHTDEADFKRNIIPQNVHYVQITNNTKKDFRKHLKSLRKMLRQLGT